MGWSERVVYMNDASNIPYGTLLVVARRNVIGTAYLVGDTRVCQSAKSRGPSMDGFLCHPRAYLPRLTFSHSARLTMILPFNILRIGVSMRERYVLHQCTLR